MIRCFLKILILGFFFSSNYDYIAVAQQNKPYFLSVGYANFYSDSHDSHLSNIFSKGVYIRSGLENSKIVSPFISVSYSRNYKKSINNTTKQLLNFIGGIKIQRKKWILLPTYGLFYVGMENSKLKYDYDMSESILILSPLFGQNEYGKYSLNHSIKSFIVGFDSGIRYPIDSFISGDIAYGYRGIFGPASKKNYVPHWRLGIIFDFSKLSNAKVKSNPSI